VSAKANATSRLVMLSFLVAQYDEALAWFRDCLGFRVLQDTVLSAEKRWVVIEAPAGGVRLLLARASTPEQTAAIGRQAAGRVFLFLETRDFVSDLSRMQRAGVQFAEAPRQEPYGQVVVFFDLYGNKWDLIEAAQPASDGAHDPA